MDSRSDMQVWRGVRLVAITEELAVGVEVEPGSVLAEPARRFTFQALTSWQEENNTDLLSLDQAQLESTMARHLCAIAEPNARRVHVLMRKEVAGVLPALALRLQPRCVALGFCDLPENADGRCRVRPHRSSLGLVPGVAGAVLEATAP
ncbi:MAG TPA: hypothetical protein VGW38_11250 [Chloroflexota bacterium]|nr:hypothetical protein [Chloroflexota bacterium]